MKELSAGDMVERTLNHKTYVSVDDEMIVINVVYEYEIARSRCDTPEKLLGWMVHLCEKNWISPTVLDEFAYKAASAAGFEITFA